MQSCLLPPTASKGCWNQGFRGDPHSLLTCVLLPPSSKALRPPTSPGVFGALQNFKEDKAKPVRDEYEYVSDDGELKIDEFPIRRKKNAPKRDLSFLLDKKEVLPTPVMKPKLESAVYKHSDDSSDEGSLHIDTDTKPGRNAKVKKESGSAAGILDLLQASEEVGALEYNPNSQPPASPSTQEAIQGMLSMANLQASDSCLQTTWGAGQAKGSSLAAHGGRKNGGGSKSSGKRLLKRSAKNSVDLDDYEEEQDHLDACFKDSDYDVAHVCLSIRGPLCGSCTCLCMLRPAPYPRS
ncbi:Hypothetical predicted protein [Marmota monax]|uniref:Uncharacterized protein n=1 Tax=Marmota monax TaxID=9995 RepID=A0A5E4DJB5_MARMO|nr:Hypothetical predicted protein [Marmota monax]